jgi:tetratricopeptide (TPR) repeat protein
MSRAGLVGFVVLASTGALAAPDKGGIVDPFATGTHPDSANRKRAGELSAQSAQHYKRGEFEVAAALLRQAYALYPEPNLLYNLARALEGMGDKSGAVDAYESYLAQAKHVDDRGAIERRVTTLKAEVAASAHAMAEPTPAAAAPAPLVEPPRPVDRITPPSKLPWIPIVGGLAVIGTGVAFGISANNLETMANDEPVALDAEDLHDSARNNATIANAMLVVGGAALVSGIVWEVIVLRRQSKKTDLPGPRPVASARSVALEWTW